MCRSGQALGCEVFWRLSKPGMHQPCRSPRRVKPLVLLAWRILMNRPRLSKVFVGTKQPWRQGRHQRGGHLVALAHGPGIHAQGGAGRAGTYEHRRRQVGHGMTL